MKKALIVGFAGQDGSILKDILIEKEYSVIGIEKDSIFSHLFNLNEEKIDILDFAQVSNLIKEYKPDEIYFLAAYHHSSQDRVPDELTTFQSSFQINTLALFNFLESLRLNSPQSRLFYAASSHIFGEPKEEVQTEATPINPICLYGISKATGLFLCRYFRKKFSIFASVGILYNHESKYRKAEFLSKKIILGALSIKKKEQDSLILGDLNAVADWGYAPDYVRAFIEILNCDQADDFIVASGQKHIVKEFVETAFKSLGLDWQKHVKVNPELIQKSKRCLVGNHQKLTNKTGWTPAFDFESLIKKLLEDEGAFNGR